LNNIIEFKIKNKQQIYTKFTEENLDILLNNSIELFNYDESIIEYNKKKINKIFDSGKFYTKVFDYIKYSIIIKDIFKPQADESIFVLSCNIPICKIEGKKDNYISNIYKYYILDIYSNKKHDKYINNILHKYSMELVLCDINFNSNDYIIMCTQIRIYDGKLYNILSKYYNMLIQ
jgi:hypothetical protein